MKAKEKKILPKANAKKKTTRLTQKKNKANAKKKKPTRLTQKTKKTKKTQTQQKKTNKANYRSGIANLETWFFSAMFYFQILANLI